MLKRKNSPSPQINIPPQVLSVWSPGGMNTANFCYSLARELAKYTRVLLVELPCLGIPHLSFAANVLNRDKHVEAALMEFWYKGEITLDYLHKVGENLSILPISPFANPVNPLCTRVELAVLLEFPVQMINSARQKGYNLVIFICQGQLTHPLTFFALKNSEHIIMPVNEPSTIAYSLLNIKTLIQTFRVPPERFMVISAKNIETISEVMSIKNENQEATKIKCCSAHIEKMIENLFGKELGSDKFRKIKKSKGKLKGYSSEELKNCIKNVLGEETLGDECLSG